MSSETQDRSRDLFDAAKLDGPSERAREAMWTGIHGATAGGVTSLAAMKASSHVVGIASSKLALGIALGATLTVGIAATVVALVRPSAMIAPRTSLVMNGHAEPRTLEHVTRNVEAPPPVIVTGRAVATPQAAVELDAKPVVAEPVHERTATAMLSEHDRLAREARMVSEARGALHRGEPETAVRIVRAARAQSGARLVPEELTVEAQALRAMGDEAGAQRVEAELAGKFPEQAIAH